MQFIILDFFGKVHIMAKARTKYKALYSSSANSKQIQKVFAGFEKANM